MAAIPPTTSTPIRPASDADTTSNLRRVAQELSRRIGDDAETGVDYSSAMRGVDARAGGAGAPGAGVPLHALAFGPVFAAPGTVVKAATPSNVDRAVEDLTIQSLPTDQAVALWESLSSSEQDALVARLIEKHPAAAAEFANQLGQHTDDAAAKAFWKAAESWMTTAVADDGYHSARLPQARAFMDEVAMLTRPEGKATKAYASRMLSNIQFSDEFGKLSSRASRSRGGVAEAARERAQLHLDTWKGDLRSGEDASLDAMARQDPEGFVKTLNDLRGDKKAYDAALSGALSQPDVDFTGRGVRGSHTTDPYMENLLDAVGKYGSAEVRADFAVRGHKGGSLRPGYDDVKAARRDLMADPEVLSILLHEKAEVFSTELRDMIANDPARAQKIIGAGVAGYTIAYHSAMAKNPPDLKAAEKAAYDLGLLLGETKESATEAFESDPAGGYNFLEGVFGIVSKQVLGLIPGGHLAVDIGKEVLGEVSGHFTKKATEFREDGAPAKIADAVHRFVEQMFAATKESFWALRDPDGTRNKVRSSDKLDGLKAEYEQFGKWLEAGYAAGRDGHSNSRRSL